MQAYILKHFFKKMLLYTCFTVSFATYFVPAKHVRVAASAKYPLVFHVSLSHKMLPLTLFFPFSFFGSFHSSIRSDMFYKEVLLKVSENLQENTCVRVFFLIKLHTMQPATLLKRDSNTDVLLWILRNC